MNERARAMISSSVKYYTMASVEIGFPEDKVCCALCPLLETYARQQCRRTGEYITETKTVGYYCPLNVIEELQKEKER